MKSFKSSPRSQVGFLAMVALIGNVSACNGGNRSVAAGEASLASTAAAAPAAASAVVTAAGVPLKIVDSSRNSYQYSYGPSIIFTKGRYYNYFCSAGKGVGDWDHVRVVSSLDLVTWTAPVDIVQTTNDTTERAVCDPSVVLANDGYYYMFYGGNALNVQTLMFVARSKTPMGPWAKYNTVKRWEVDAEEPQVIISPLHAVADGAVPTAYGTGQPTVVYLNNEFYMWFLDDSATYPTVQARLYFTKSSDGIHWSERVVTSLTGLASVDVKYDKDSQTWYLFGMENMHLANAYMSYRTSKDGLAWSAPVSICENKTCLPPYSNNPGVAGDERGFLISHDIFISYGAPYDASPSYRDNDCKKSPQPYCWGYWDLYASSVSLALDGDVYGIIDGVERVGEKRFVRGWACQVGRADQIAVHIYAGGGAGAGRLVASGLASLASEDSVAAACLDGAKAAHRFSVEIPATVGAGEKIWVHGISTLGRTNAPIPRSGFIAVPR